MFTSRQVFRKEWHSVAQWQILCNSATQPGAFEDGFRAKCSHPSIVLTSAGASHSADSNMVFDISFEAKDKSARSWAVKVSKSSQSRLLADVDVKNSRSNASPLWDRHRLTPSVETFLKPTSFPDTYSLMTLQNSFYGSEMNVVECVSFPFDSIRLKPDGSLQKLQHNVPTVNQHLTCKFAATLKEIFDKTLEISSIKKSCT